MIRGLLVVLSLTGAFGRSFAPPEESINININSDEGRHVIAFLKRVTDAFGNSPTGIQVAEVSQILRKTVSNGFRFTINADLTEMGCVRSGFESQCKPTEQIKSCSIHVSTSFVQSGPHRRYSLQGFECDRPRTLHNKPGGEKDVEDLVHMKSVFMRYIRSQVSLGDDDFIGVRPWHVTIISAKSSVTNGIRYKVDVEIDGDFQGFRSCEVTFIERPWGDPKFIKEFSVCGTHKKRTFSDDTVKTSDNPNDLKPIFMKFVDSHNSIGSSEFSNVDEKDINIVSAFSKATDDTGSSIRHSVTVEINTGGYGKKKICHVTFVSNIYQSPKYKAEQIKCRFV